MRKLIIGAVTAAALLGAPAAAGAATAAPPKWTPVTDPLGAGHRDGSITLPATTYCAFDVKVAVVANGELQNVTTLPDGTTITKIMGPLVLRFTNDTAPRKAIVKDVSGSTTTTVSPNGNITEQGDGANWWGIGPVGRMNTGEPGLVFTYGPVTVTVALEAGEETVQTFSLHGAKENGCALLS
jgi:hypothetical protein